MPTAYVEQIKKHYPDLAINQAKLDATGQNSTIVIVNDDLIFRFPRYTEGIQALPQEVKVLNALKGRLPLAIPEPLYYHQADDAGECFVGYKMIKGGPLTRDLFQTLSDKTRAELAKQLVEFLTTLHQTPIDVVDDITRDDLPEFWHEFYGKIRDKLYQFMRGDAKEKLDIHFQAYFDDPVKYTPALRHGDFGTFNLVFDADAGKLNGVIDFGDVAIGDPAIDFAGVYISYKDDFYKEVMKHTPEIEAYLPRIKFYIGTFPLFEALHGFENDDKEAFDAGMEQYI